MQKVVLASGNRGKVREFNQILAHCGLEVMAQTELGVEEVEESGLTFVENAILKARAAAEHTGLPAIADDSGLEVDFLKGAPGIYSARYAGVGASDQENIDRLLTALEGVAEADRSARFQCLMVFMRHGHDPTPIICSGTWEGSIGMTQQGTNGFGYDPVFWPAQHQCSSAQLEPEQKNDISHRGMALRQMQIALQAR